MSFPAGTHPSWKAAIIPYGAIQMRELRNQKDSESFSVGKARLHLPLIAQSDSAVFYRLRLVFSFCLDNHSHLAQLSPLD